MAKKRVAKKKTVKQIEKKSLRKMRVRTTWIILSAVMKMTGAFAVIGAALGFLYVAANAYQGMIHAAGKGMLVFRASVAEAIEPEGITFAADWQTAEPMGEEENLDSIIASAARAYDLPESTLRKLFHVESSLNPNAVSPDGGAIGIGQLRRHARNHLSISEREARDPRTAVEGAAAWLAMKREEQGSSLDEAIQSYYCGPSCVGKPQGLAYLKKVNKAPVAPSLVQAKRETGAKNG